MSSEAILEVTKALGIELKRATAAEYCGPCPFCGGVDRFRVWPDRGRWWCRRCDESGDVIDLLRRAFGYSYEEACRCVGRPLLPQPTRRETESRPTRSEIRESSFPSARWQACAEAFAAWAHGNLLSRPDKLEWLEKERGIKLETVKAFRLGWNPTKLYRDRSKWGLPTEGKTKLLLPAGLVIPAYRDGQIIRLRVRLEEPHDGQRYFVVSGSATDCFVIGHDRRAFFVVESELDALLLEQEAQGLAGYIALGSATTRPDTATDKLLRGAEKVFLALDEDTAGEEALRWWVARYPTASICPFVEGKDPTESHLAGNSLSEWVAFWLEKDAIGGPISDSESGGSILPLPERREGVIGQENATAGNPITKPAVAADTIRPIAGTIGRFIRECCTVSPKVVCKVSYLFEEYQDWARRRGFIPDTIEAFEATLQKAGYEIETDQYGRWALGIGVKD